MNITEIREGIASVLQEFGEVQVWLAPNELGSSFGGEVEDLKFSVKVIVDPEAGDPEVRIDDLFEDVPNTIRNKATLNGVVSDSTVVWCSGHRMYGAPPPAPPYLGCEFHIKVTV